MPYLKLDLEYITVKVKVTGESNTHLSAVGLLAYRVGGREKSKKGKRKKRKKEELSSSRIQFCFTHNITSVRIHMYVYICHRTIIIYI